MHSGGLCRCGSKAGRAYCKHLMSSCAKRHQRQASFKPCNTHDTLAHLPNELSTDCKSFGAMGCTTAAVGRTTCCGGLTCVIPSSGSSGTCAKPPSVVAAPVKGISAVIANGVVTAAVQLVAAPVTSTNGGGAPGALLMCGLQGCLQAA